MVMARIAQVVAGTALAAALALSPAAARAEIKFCNKFAHEVWVAVAYPGPGAAGGWYARGWLQLPVGTCGSFTTPPIQASTFLYHAETQAYDENGKSVRHIWGTEDAKTRFAVTYEAFLWPGADKPKPGNAFMAGFIDSGVSEKDGVLAIDVTVVFEADGSSSINLG